MLHWRTAGCRSTLSRSRVFSRPQGSATNTADAPRGRRWALCAGMVWRACPSSGTLQIMRFNTGFATPSAWLSSVLLSESGASGLRGYDRVQLAAFKAVKAVSAPCPALPLPGCSPTALHSTLHRQRGRWESYATAAHGRHFAVGSPHLCVNAPSAAPQQSKPALH